MLERDAGGYLLGGHPALVGTAELQLVTILLRLRRTQDRPARRQLHLSDTLQGIHHLLLLPAQLLAVGQTLPLAAAAYTEMRTEGLGPQFAALVKPHSHSLGIVMLLARQLQIHHIAGHHIGNKHHQVVNTYKGLAFGSHIRYLHRLI